MKHIGSKWVSTLTGQVGIVLFKDESTGEKKAFIGITSINSTEEDDVKRIKEYGAKFPAKTAEYLINL